MTRKLLQSFLAFDSMPEMDVQILNPFLYFLRRKLPLIKIIFTI